MERKPLSKIGPADAGARLIDWLSRRFTYLAADAWLGMLSEGRVTVSGLPASADALLAAGDMVAFDPPSLPEPEIDPYYALVFEDEDFLIIDKSGNLPCHPGGRYFEHSLWYLLRETYGDLRIATRLDRETSGLVLACKSSSSASFAQRALSEGRIEKDYLALVHGAFPDALHAEGILTADEASLVRKKRRYFDGSSMPEGKKAEACATSFERVGRIDQMPDHKGLGPISLIRARPGTGRTHQIRATLLSLGYPIVGDKLYGIDEAIFLRFIEGPLSEEDLNRLILPNQALHCSGISFVNGAGRRLSAASTPRWGPPFGVALR
jgi:RluA family pseudouridine synthase